MNYRLWLPHIGAYLRARRQAVCELSVTVDPDEALQLLEPEAKAFANILILDTDHVIELRPVERHVATERAIA